MERQNIPFEQAYEIWKAVLSCNRCDPQKVAEDLIEAYYIIGKSAGTISFAPDPEQPTRAMKECYHANQVASRYLQEREQALSEVRSAPSNSDSESGAVE